MRRLLRYSTNYIIPMMAESELQKIHDLLVDCALAAGEMIISARPSTSTTDTKKNCKHAVRT